MYCVLQYNSNLSSEQIENLLSSGHKTEANSRLSHEELLKDAMNYGVDGMLLVIT